MNYKGLLAGLRGKYADHWSRTHSFPCLGMICVESTQTTHTHTHTHIFWEWVAQGYNLVTQGYNCVHPNTVLVL